MAGSCNSPPGRQLTRMLSTIAFVLPIVVFVAKVVMTIFLVLLLDMKRQIQIRSIQTKGIQLATLEHQTGRGKSLRLTGPMRPRRRL